MRSDEEASWSEVPKYLGIIAVSLLLYIPKFVWGLVGMATGRYACIAFGPVTVRCLTEEESRAMDEQDWIEHGGREFENALVDDVMQEVERCHARRVSKLARPSLN